MVQRPVVDVDDVIISATFMLAGHGAAAPPLVLHLNRCNNIVIVNLLLTRKSK
jgi:hypothetical protein